MSGPIWRDCYSEDVLIPVLPACANKGWAHNMRRVNPRDDPWHTVLINCQRFVVNCVTNGRKLRRELIRQLFDLSFRCFADVDTRGWFEVFFLHHETCLAYCKCFYRVRRKMNCFEIVFLSAPN